MLIIANSINVLPDFTNLFLFFITGVPQILSI